MSLQYLRQFLEQYQLGIGNLLWIGFFCFLSAILAFREFLSWYLKVNKISHGLQELNERMDRLENLVARSLTQSHEARAPALDHERPAPKPQGAFVATVRRPLGPVAPPSSDPTPASKSHFPIHH